jgi:hypothetical protein
MQHDFIKENKITHLRQNFVDKNKHLMKAEEFRNSLDNNLNPQRKKVIIFSNTQTPRNADYYL